MDLNEYNAQGELQPEESTASFLLALLGGVLMAVATVGELAAMIWFSA